LNPIILYLIIFLPLFVITMQRRQAEAVAISRIQRKRRKGESYHMKELAQKFIGKECLVYTINSQISGTIREVNENAILLDNGKDIDLVNLDFVIRIREYPRNKKGQKKSVVLD